MGCLGRTDRLQSVLSSTTIGPIVGHAASPFFTDSRHMKVVSHTFEVKSESRLDLIDLTQKVREVFSRSMVKEGMLYLHSLHTTTAIMINEWQHALIADLKTFLQGIVDDRDYFQHNDPEHSDCVRSNATSHLRSALLSQHVMVPIEDGELALGQWQSIIFADLDGPQTRSVVAQIIGE